MTLRALLIEDDETIAEPLAEGLGRYGLTVDRAATGAAGLRGPYGDIVLLDLGLPDMDGIDVCRGIRRVSGVPIIMLTARGTEADRVLGLELGADDYLAKPFSVRELIARIRAVTRRSGVPAGFGTPDGFGPPPGFGTDPGPLQAPLPTPIPAPAPTPFQAPTPAPAAGFGFGPAFGAQDPVGFPIPVPLSTPRSAPLRAPDPAPEPAPDPDPTSPTGALIVDRRTRQVWVGERQIPLTPKEFDLLALLTEDPGAVYSRQQILDRVWDPHFHGPTKTLDVHVATLRRKLGDPAWIQTLRGVGLRLAVRTSSDALR
ncbi:response regulator transcription factor [Streptomyces paludis]|uniref:DNA-binding response regulator n=1 Tax=Streptomyces paludis TaxID=2282738 RepID=A0A345HTB1_9ACTN|nr:response regulator transcription factor [Streptomyces paludis]AXG79935.1 DNA-binding response regulator [Streptomyces paludis]